MPQWKPEDERLFAELCRRKDCLIVCFAASGCKGYLTASAFETPGYFLPRFFKRFLRLLSVGMKT